MRKIWEFIVSIPADKWMHFCAGAGVDLYSFAIFKRFCPFWLAIVIALVISLGVLIAKEVYDSKHKEEGHSVEVMDIVAGLIGIVLVDLAMLIIIA